MIEQIREFKDKYNECIQMLNKSQEEISNLKRKALRRKSSLNFSINTSKVDNHVLESFHMLKDDYDDLDSSFIIKSKNNMFSPFTSTNETINNTSFAAEVFSTISRNHRENFFRQKISKSNNFIKKVKQKMIKSVPGTSTSESCFQSEDENLTQQLDLEKKVLNCRTPDSILTTGSTSIYSNFGISNSFLNRDKLQIVKPIEGSYTLQHWQNLATPSFGCLFEDRPGITIKGNSSEAESDLREDDRDSLIDEFEFLKADLDYFEFSNKDLNRDYKSQVISPSKLQILTKLLENEDIQNKIELHKLNDEQGDQSFFGKFKSIFSNPILNKKKIKSEFSDPDTPPSSPINFEENNSFTKIFNCISNYFKNAPTPPGSPCAELIDEEENEQDNIKLNAGFFDQIVTKLKTFNKKILKYDIILSEESSEIEETQVQNKCNTPPPSPSRFSPPTPDFEDLTYTEDDLKKSAFVRVTKLNPLLNKQVDLSSLLKSLSLLKKNRRKE